MEDLDKGGQGPISGCCAIEEEEEEYDTLILALLCFVRIILIIPSTQLLSISSVCIFNHNMFRPYIWVTFRWYTRLNIYHPNRHAIYFNRIQVP
jgi:hypothetical protein